MATATDTLLTVVRMDGAQNYIRQQGQIADGMGRIARQERDMVDGMNRLGNAFLAGGAGAVALGAGLVKTAADFEVLRAKMRVAMGDSQRAAEMWEWATEFAGQTPFTVDQVIDVTAQLELLGLEATKWLPKIGDMAGAMGADVSHAANAVAKATMGQMESLRESYGVSNRALKEYGANVNEQGQLIRQTTQDQERFNEALFAFMSDKFAGGMSQRMETLYGQISNLQDALSQAGAALGQEFLPEVTATVESLADMVRWFKDLEPITRQIIGDMLKFSAVTGIVGGLGLKFAALTMQVRLTQAQMTAANIAQAQYTAGLEREAWAATQAAGANARLAAARGAASSAAGAGGGAIQVSTMEALAGPGVAKIVAAVLPYVPYIVAAVAGVAIPYYASGVSQAQKEAEEARERLEGMRKRGEKGGYWDIYTDPMTGLAMTPEQRPTDKEAFLDELERQGLIERRKHGLFTRYAVTERGMEVLPQDQMRNIVNTGEPYTALRDPDVLWDNWNAGLVESRSTTLDAAEAEVERTEAIADTEKAIKRLRAQQQFLEQINAPLVQRKQVENDLANALKDQADAALAAGDAAEYWAKSAEYAALTIEEQASAADRTGVWSAYREALESLGASDAQIERARRGQIAGVRDQIREALRAGDIRGYYNAAALFGDLTGTRNEAARALGASSDNRAHGLFSPEQFANYVVENNIEVAPEVRVFVQQPDGSMQEAQKTRIEISRERWQYYQQFQ